MDNPGARKVVIGLLGSRLDSDTRADRWLTWRPSVSVCQHENLLVDRFELLFGAKEEKLVEFVAADIASVSPETEVRTHPLPTKDPWDFEEVYAALHDFARAYPFDTEAEEYLVHITTGTHVAQICLFLLTESRHLPGKLLQCSPPARRHKQDPIGNYRIIDLDLSRYDRLATRFALDQKQAASFLKSGIETRNAAFNRLIDRIERVVIASSAPLLLTGPTGAGKSQLARRIYELKRQRQQIAGPFVEVNCATVRGDQAMSALFGHMKGAFTGATTDRPGLLRAADGGMLFLDEIGELGADEQAMLLRAVEEKRFLPVGSDRDVQSDFQLIAGTNRDLAAEVGQGRFREDLLSRINLWTFRLPGLASRREDIEPNLDYELEQYTARTGLKVTFNKEARRRFVDFAMSDAAAWRANFRDLNGAVTRMATLAPGNRINVETVDEEIARLESAWRDSTPEADESLLASVLGPERTAELDRFDRVQLAEAIRVCRQSKTLSDAGRRLFGVSRTRKKLPNDADRLRKYLGRFGLGWDDLREMPN
ncbi:MAG: sigma 54-interacting transcriptional regulator [Pirellulaceae bacterium]|nr:sigma 54-interacting transcriptional regulator [Pirellulaceae bacterium]